jgi:DNA-binding transcriptional MerR regulator
LQAKPDLEWPANLRLTWSRLQPVASHHEQGPDHGEAAKAAGLSIDAVRFYERQDIMAPPPRLAGGRRAYGPEQMRELTTIARARAVRIPLAEIGRYLSLARQGDATLPERTGIISHQRQKVVKQIAALQETLGILDLKLSRAAGMSMAHKDVGLALAAGGDANLPLPLASLLCDRVLQALASGGEALNVSALARVAARYSPLPGAE